MLAAVDPPATPTAFRIGDFVFEPATGEIRGREDTGGRSAVRLAPQPSKLLELLIEKGGELVTREEIRARLWPETHVDFDQGLHFCIRQIRSALGDSASRPTYVETLPRRGYRLMRPGRPIVSSAPPAATDARKAARGAASRRRSARQALVVIAPALLAVAATLGIVRSCPGPEPRQPIRLAIMPFERGGPAAGSEDRALVSEWLVAELADGRGDRLEVIGPRSTAGYSALPFPQLDRLAADLAIDFVLNARAFARDGEQGLLVELIRLDDGAHLWAEFFTGERSWQAIARRVEERVVEALDLAAVSETGS